MNIGENVRFNRTKMLDEAALNHVPTHFMFSFLKFLIVYMIASLIATIISGIPQIIYLFSNDEFSSAIIDFSFQKITVNEYIEIGTSVLLNAPAWLSILTLLASGTFIPCAILYCRWFEKRKIKTLGLRKANVSLEYLSGIAIGLVMCALAVLIAYLCGSIEISFNKEKISPVIILFFFAFVIQGMGEELLFRGYFMTSVARDYKVALAVAFSSVVFSFMHAGNGGFNVLAFLNITLFGLFLGIYILKRGNLWGACAIHTMWNFTLGNIFGSSVSGNVALPSIFKVSSDMQRVAANGGSFGIEGGFATTIVLIIAIGLVLLLKPNQKELPEYELNMQSNI